MADLTAAERMKRYRARKKAAGDPVRAFCQGVIADSKAAVAAGTAAPWHLSTADTAQDLLEKLDAAVRLDVGAGHGAAMQVIALAHGAFTAEDRGDIAQYHESQFQRWQAGESKGTPKAVKTERVELAESSLAWAEGERVAGRATSPITRQGLRSAARLIRARTAPDTAGMYARYTQQITALSLASLGGDIQPPYGAPEE